VPATAEDIRPYIREFDFERLFIDLLGWDHCRRPPHDVAIDDRTFTLAPVAEKRGMVAFVCEPTGGGTMPDRTTRQKIERQVAKTFYEHLVIFADVDRTTQVWQWARREPGRPIATREHTYHTSQPGDSLIAKLKNIEFSLEEEEQLTIVGVSEHARRAFDVERVTKRFYDRFKSEHATFLNFVKGIPDKDMSRYQPWYASVLVNRLMFIYFIQKKGFLDGDVNYLRTKLTDSARRGKDRYYQDFLCPLFFEGFARKPGERLPETNQLLGTVPYLDGGLFLRHQIEEQHGETIHIADEAFKNLFDYFEAYDWPLEPRPPSYYVEHPDAKEEISPDVLGYIFEKYINQKQMGAYYTKPDITGYISRNTVIPRILDIARQNCKVAFEGDGSVWRLLQEDPDRYIYPAVKHGIVVNARTQPGEKPQRLERPYELPPEIAAGLDDMSKRHEWNRSAPETHALPTEIWREVVARRQRYEEVRGKLANGDVCQVNDLITLNLDIEQLGRDVINKCEGPELLRAIWHAIRDLSVLDPTCGSGAFLFAALNILYDLYDDCLDRMESFLGDEAAKVDRAKLRFTKHNIPLLPHDKFKDFTTLLDSVGHHPNRRYFILKSIILNNLYGVDIMEEAVEICKLRLFLKLVAQVDSADRIEPLPDIDFNICAGNSLVGYATYDEVKRAVTSKLDFGNAMERIEQRASDVGRRFGKFREQQTELHGDVQPEDREALRASLRELEEELSGYLASEYGKDPTNPRQYDSWVKSHQAFHWLVGFYDTMKKGGFDSIIGNPPYLEYSKVKDYEVLEYATGKCANLYTFAVEKSFALVHHQGRVGMIIPVSVACSDAMEPLRRLLLEDHRSLWLSHFSNRPGQLLAGAQNRLTILLASSQLPRPRRYSTRYHRWNAKGGERDALFPTLRYQEFSEEDVIYHGLLPKVGYSEAVNTMKKINGKLTIRHIATRRGQHNVFWVRVPGYFCQFLLDPPMARPENGGRSRVRGEVNCVTFDNEHDRSIAYSVLNSSTFYQFFCSYTDTRHINPSDVMEFPLDLSTFDRDTKKRLTDLSAQLAQCHATHTSVYRKSGLLIDSIVSKACKPIIDEIDRVLAKHYGFTDEELDFIINYDIKYRMGAENLDGEEDD